MAGDRDHLEQIVLERADELLVTLEERVQIVLGVGAERADRFGRQREQRGERLPRRAQPSAARSA